MVSSLPDGFEWLYSAVETTDEKFRPRNFSAIGMVTDLLPPKRSNDWMVSFKITDKSWIDSSGAGLQCRFFARNESELPPIQSTGDVIIIRSAWLKEVNGQRLLTASASPTERSSWIVIHQQDIPEDNNLIGELAFAKKSDKVASPDKGIFEYITQLYNTYGRAMFGHQMRTHKDFGANKSSLTEQTFKPSDKFKLIEDLISPEVISSNQFADLLVEVRRIYDTGFHVELGVTDYTSHKDLHNYLRSSEDNQGREGDEYGYTKTSNSWPGPWGRMSMTVAAWDSHAELARSRIKLGHYLRLSNVHISRDKDGVKMEGNIRVSPYDPSRVCLTIMNARKAESDARMKALLLRKTQYKKGPDCQGVGEITSLKRPIEEEEEEAEAEQPEPPNNQPEQKLSKGQKKKKKGREKKEREEKEANNKATATAAPRSRPSPANDIKKGSLNPNIRTNKVPDHVVPVTIAEILDPATLESSIKTAKGNSFSLPFKNNLYHLGKVRVIDFNPPDLVNFAAPVEDNDSDDLSSDEDLVPTSDDNMDVDASGDKSKWEWRFELLLEDASISQLSATREKGRMKLIVAGVDAEFLLRFPASDLRQDETTLKKLKEKLFLLWGDLEERKAEERKNAEAEKNEEHAIDEAGASGRPFECTIKEYGVKANDGAEWERTFAIFATTING